MCNLKNVKIFFSREPSTTLKQNKQSVDQFMIPFRLTFKQIAVAFNQCYSHRISLEFCDMITNCDKISQTSI